MITNTYPIPCIHVGQSCTFNRVIKLLKETGDVVEEFPLYSKIAHTKKDTRVKDLRAIITNFHLKGAQTFHLLRQTILGDRIKLSVKRPLSAPSAKPLGSTTATGNPIPSIMHPDFDKSIAAEMMKEKTRTEEANRLLSLMDSPTFQTLPLDKRQRIESKYWSIIGL